LGAVQQANKRRHGISVQRNRSMTDGGLAATDRRHPAEEIHVLPAQVLDLNATARR
jgi:hypothetical protein